MIDVELPSYAKNIFDPWRYKVAYGGRGSGKSYTFARTLIIKSAQTPSFILCGREYQNSIKDSVHSLLASQIERMGLKHRFKITDKYIEEKKLGSRFIFKGVYQNVESIKSIPDLTDLWLEEAQTVSQRSWDILIPTLRQEGSEIWVTFNPENDDDPTYLKFLGPDGPPPNTLLMKANFRDNPWFPDVLRAEKDQMKKTNFDLYQHVWEGETRSNSDAQIFKDKFSVETFDVNPRWSGPYFGADWGFSIDPTALIKFYVDIENNILYISHEAGGVGIDIDATPALFDQIPESRKHRILADNARPETISYVSRSGFLIEAAKKWKGSVEDGIAFLRSFTKIIIHSRCTETPKEFRKYSYKIDRITGKITTHILDEFNHYIDALRYGAEPMILRNKEGILSLV